MFAFGFVILALAVWLGDSAVQNRSPIATLEAIIKDPANTRQTLASSKGTGYRSNSAGTGVKHGSYTGTAVPSGGGSAVALAAVAYAMAQVGKPYEWGGTGPAAYDCSGLCYASYKAAGMTIPRNTAAQIVGGQAVAKKDLQPGDLVFPYPGHVFLYAGSGQAVEAPHTGEAVKVTNVYGFLTARRYA